MRTKANNPIILFSLIALLSVASFGCKESVLSTKEGDEQALKVLFADVEKIAYQYPCENAGEWKFIAVGARPCGGASSFVAYSSKVNEQMLFEKIKLFTEKEASFNAKYNPTSPCALIVAPKGVACENGKPKLVY